MTGMALSKNSILQKSVETRHTVILAISPDGEDNHSRVALSGCKRVTQKGRNRNGTRTV